MRSIDNLSFTVPRSRAHSTPFACLALEGVSDDLLESIARVCTHHARLALSATCSRLHRICRPFHETIVLATSTQVRGFLRCAAEYCPKRLVLRPCLRAEDIFAILAHSLSTQVIRLSLPGNVTQLLIQDGLISPFAGKVELKLPCDDDVRHFASLLATGALAHVVGLELTLVQYDGSSGPALMKALASVPLRSMRSLRLVRFSAQNRDTTDIPFPWIDDEAMSAAVVCFANAMPRSMPCLASLDLGIDEEETIMTEESIDDLFVTMPIRALSSLTELRTCGTCALRGLSDGAMSALNEHMENFELRGVYRISDIVPAMVEGHLSRLTGLSIQTDSYEAIGDVFACTRASSPLHRLKWLELDGDFTRDVQGLLGALQAGTLSGLERVGLHHYTTRDVISHIVPVLDATVCHAPRLRELSLSLQETVILEKLASVVPQLHGLTDLKLIGPTNDRVNDGVIGGYEEALGKVLSELPMLRKLQQLTLCHILGQACHIGPLQRALTGCPMLKTVAIEGCTEEFKVMQCLRAAHSGGGLLHLSELRLEDVDLTSFLIPSFGDLLESLSKAGGPKLSTLSLCGNKIGPEAQLGALFACHTLTNLAELDLSISDLRNGSFVSFSHGLVDGNLPMLQELRAAEAHLVTDDVVALATAATCANVLRRLTKLDLSMNDVGSTGAKAIIDAAGEGAWPKLEELLLCHSGVQSPGDLVLGRSDFGALPALEVVLLIP